MCFHELWGIIHNEAMFLRIMLSQTRSKYSRSLAIWDGVAILVSSLLIMILLLKTDKY